MSYKNRKVATMFKYVLLSIVVLFVGIYFMKQKENLDIDEIYTFGLSNSSFQLKIDDFKEYTGDELLKSYATVNDNNKFDIKNVVFNQEMDTHPPIYYMLINFVCSLTSKSFSMWQGLLINLLFLVILYFQMAYILRCVIKDRVLPYVLSMLALFFYGFINEIVFIRMYVVLSVESMALVILILNRMKSLYIEKRTVADNTSYDPLILKNNSDIIKSEIIFLIKYILICIVGTLTQYHFMIVAGFMSLIYAIYLIRLKKYKSLIFTFIIGVLSILISVALFPGMINHLFGGSSLHALNNEQVTDIPSRLLEILKTVYVAFFGKGIYIYISILLIGIVFYFILYKKNKVNDSIKADKEKVNFIDIGKIDDENFNIILYVVLFILIIFYYFVVSLTTTFTFARYLYNIYPYIFIVIISPIYILYKSVKPVFKHISVILILILTVTSKLTAVPFSLNAGDSIFHSFLNENKDTKMILLYRSIDKNGNVNTMGTTSKWKLPRPLYSFKDMENMTFVDISYDEKLKKSTSESICGYDDIFLVIYTTEDDNKYINEIMKKNNVTSCSKVYFANYFHMYRLTK